SASGGSGGGRGINGLSSKLKSDDSLIGMESSISNSSRKRMSHSESLATFSIPGGIELSEARNKSASSKRGSLDESSKILLFTTLINLS
nr:hypothetical protein [Tanacetum cinerariifolium]